MNQAQTEIFHSDQFHKVYNQAYLQCQELSLGYMVSEHVLYYSLFNTELIEKMLSKTSFQVIAAVRQGLEQYLSDIFPLINIHPDELALITKNMVPQKLGEYELELETSQVAAYCNLSPALSRIMDRAAWLVKENAKLISLESFILSIFSETNNIGAKILTEAGLTKELFETVLNVQVKPKVNEKEKSLMFKFCRNLFQEVTSKQGYYLTRDAELFKMAEIFARKEKNNLVLTGPAGVGKSSLIEQMIVKMNDKKFSPAINKSSVLQLDISALVAGTKFRGEFEERMDALVKEFLSYKKNCILVVDNLHLVVGSGSSNGMDMAHFLMPILNCEHLRLVGTTSQEDWREVIEQQSSFARFFEKVEVKSLSQEDTLSLVKEKSKEFGDYHKVSYPGEILKDIVTLSSKDLIKKSQPEAAIDLLDRVGAKISLSREKTGAKVSQEAVYQTLSEITNLPSLKIAQSEKEKVLSLQSRMTKSIFGQEEAVKRLGQAIVVAKSGLRDTQKTMGSFLFVGPTGVGKTELSLILAEELGMPLLRFDMSEYMEPHSISKLIGSPPGYVGYGKGGLLSEKIEEYPQAVVLIDELEKAHSDIHNIFLQIMDNGFFRDAQGRTINCQNIILIMTSNLGAKEAQSSGVGLNSIMTSSKQDVIINENLRPEFINRLDSLIKFSALGPKELALILNQHIAKLNQQLTAHSIQISLSPEVNSYFISKAEQEKMGARPLKRLIDSELKRELGLKILEGVSSKKIEVSLESGDLKFNYAEN